MCDNPSALQFVGSKQEVSLVIIALFSIESGSFGPKKQPSEKWKAITSPRLGRERPSRGTAVDSAWGLPVKSLIVSRKQQRGNSEKPRGRTTMEEEKGRKDL